MKKSLLLCLMIMGCATNQGQDQGQEDVAARWRRPDAAVVHVDAPPPSKDAAGGGGGGTAGSVTCYLSAAPNNTCSLSTSHCCFTEYDASQNGTCEALSTSCPVGEIDCDGSEDCASGQRCFAHHWWDSGDMPHWLLACAATATDPTQDLILCHPGDGTCPSGTTCTQTDTAGVHDLPQTIYVCH